MYNLKWNLKKIYERRKYITERIKCSTEKDEQEKLELSLIAYLGMDNLLKNESNLFDKIKSGNFKKSINKDVTDIEEKVVDSTNNKTSKEYILFLISLTKNLYKEEHLVDKSLEKLEISKEQLTNFVLSIYDSMGNEQISNIVRKILNSEEINIVSKINPDFEEFGGITINDYIFNKSYINCHIKDNIFDFQVICHEIMHSIDFYLSQKMPSNTYYGFHEIPTYFLDNVVIDYMKNCGFNSKEVDKLTYNKKAYIIDLASALFQRIMFKVKRKFKTDDLETLTEDQLKEIINIIDMKELLEIQSFLIANSLYEQYNIDNKLAINNLIGILSNKMSKDEIPSFELYGITNEQIINSSMHIKESFENVEPEEFNIQR